MMKRYLMRTLASAVAAFPAALCAGLGGSELTSITTVDANTDFGDGDIVLASGGSLLVNAAGPSVTVPNKVVFKGQGAMYTYVSSMSHDSSVILKSVGTPAESETHHIRLGRASAAGLGWVTLSLTDPASEALDEIRLAGTLRLTLDGGVIRARGDAKAPFFRQMDAAGAVAVDITGNGVAFEVAENAHVALSHPVSVTAGETREVVAETYYPENWSFEDYTGNPLAQSSRQPGDWEDEPHPNAHNEYTQVCTNGGAFDTDGDRVWSTTNGMNYAMVRRGSSMKRAVNLPAAGEWRVVFELGCRPLGTYSVNQTAVVSIDDTTMLTVGGVNSAELHGFREYVTPAFSFGAGEHTLRLAVADSAQGSASLNFDAVRLERIVNEPVITPVVKEGAGVLVLADQKMPQTSLTAAAGNLVLSNLDMDERSTVEVKRGATLCLSGAQNSLVKNGNFEFDGHLTGVASAAVYGWNVECRDPQSREKCRQNGYLQMNGGNLPPEEAAHTPYGDMTAYLRPMNRMSQTVSIAESGRYVFSFVVADRSYSDSYSISVTAKVDGDEVVQVPAAAQYRAFRRYSAELELAAGDHVIEIAAGDSRLETAGAMVFIDDVSLVASGVCDLKPAFRMQSGSVLELDNSAPLHVRKFYVDGVRVNGGRSALIEAGVAVTGSGRIAVGDRRGFLMIMR